MPEEKDKSNGRKELMGKLNRIARVWASRKESMISE